MTDCVLSSALNYSLTHSPSCLYSTPVCQLLSYSGTRETYGSCKLVSEGDKLQSDCLLPVCLSVCVELKRNCKPCSTLIDSSPRMTSKRFAICICIITEENNCSMVIALSVVAQIAYCVHTSWLYATA